MLAHSFKIRRLINNANYYGLIEIAGESTGVRKLEIEYDDLNVEEEWYSSIECGVKFFYHYYNLAENRGLHIHVKKTHTMIGDTTPMTVFYITVKCLMEMFKYSGELINLNENSGVYTVVR